MFFNWRLLFLDDLFYRYGISYLLAELPESRTRLVRFLSRFTEPNQYFGWNKILETTVLAVLTIANGLDLIKNSKKGCLHKEKYPTFLCAISIFFNKYQVNCCYSIIIGTFLLFWWFANILLPKLELLSRTGFIYLFVKRMLRCTLVCRWF